MKKGLLALLVLSLVGCSEYGFKTPQDSNTVFGPPPDLVHEVTTDRFLQAPFQPADVLFAIDHSCSMSDDNANINANIPYFFDVLDVYNLDYHVGVMSTEGISETSSGLISSWGSEPFIDSNTPNPESYFSLMNNSTVGYGEQGLDAFLAATTLSYDHNREFFRPEVPLHLIVISDEPDQSVRMNSVRFVDWTNNWLELKKEADVTFSAVVFTTTSDCGTGWEVPDSSYTYVSNHIGGEVVDICEDDWSLTLEALAEHAVNQRYEYFLSRNPVEGSFNVLVERGEITFAYELDDQLSEERTGDYYYNQVRNSIVFYEYTHLPGDVVLVEYEIEGTYIVEGM